jgi:hypothetical protein
VIWSCKSCPNEDLEKAWFFFNKHYNMVASYLKIFYFQGITNFQILILKWKNDFGILGKCHWNVIPMGTCKVNYMKSNVSLGAWVGIEFVSLWFSFCSKLHQPYSMYICVVDVIEKCLNEPFLSLSSQSCCTFCPNCEKLRSTPMVLQTFVIAKIKEFTFDIIW